MDTRQGNTIIIKQNILKNITVVLVTTLLILWVLPYLEGLGDSGVDAFVLLSIFPLGAMFAYFAFSYANTNIFSSEHRILADITTFILLIIICFSISLATIIGSISIPQLTNPLIILAVLLVLGCFTYDFWDLYSNLTSQKKSEE
ncbi:MAG: hypothetical protein HQ530_00400 [Parcubacteria group bacterium]|nr:hypothetical protein [Parcubacteria group bacterium]